MSNSILRSWVECLSLREQGTLLTAVRGCDLAPKNPVDSIERQLTAFVRWCVLNPADPRELGHLGAFMQDAMPLVWKPSALEHYPLHWVIHMMHALEVIGYRHPADDIAAYALDGYLKMVHGLHLEPESRYRMIQRMTEDRIASGTVVS